jgi:DNA-binding NarL/FixJ family response regulator
VGALVGAATVAVGAGTRPVRGRWARRHSVRDRLPGVAAEAAATAPPQEVDPTGKSLTPRENEVVAELTLGLTNRQIAEKLVISESTVKRHVENILDKLGFESRTQIAAWATLLGSRDGDEESRTTRDAG